MPRRTISFLALTCPIPWGDLPPPSHWTSHWLHLPACLTPQSQFIELNQWTLAWKVVVLESLGITSLLWGPVPLMKTPEVGLPECQALHPVISNWIHGHPARPGPWKTSLADWGILMLSPEGPSESFQRAPASHHQSNPSWQLRLNGLFIPGWCPGWGEETHQKGAKGYSQGDGACGGRQGSEQDGGEKWDTGPLGASTGALRYFFRVLPVPHQPLYRWDMPKVDFTWAVLGPVQRGRKGERKASTISQAPR